MYVLEISGKLVEKSSIDRKLQKIGVDNRMEIRFMF